MRGRETMIRSKAQSTSAKKLNQTKISSYFTGCVKSIPFSQKSPKKKRSSNIRRKLSFSCSMGSSTEILKSTKQVALTNVSPENLSLIANIPKRKLPAPIFSDDENSDSENQAREDNCSPKKSKCIISVNKETCSVSFQRTSIKWTPSLSSPEKTPTTSVSSLIETSSKDLNSTSDNLQEQTPSCSTTKFDNLNTTKPIRVLQNVILQSPKKSPQKNGNFKDETKKVNYEQLKVMREFFINVLKNNYLLRLINESDRDFLYNFYNAERNYQFVCIKLFLWQPLWYNIFRFIEKINLPMDDSEVAVMYKYLSQNGFVDVDYMREDLFTLLDVLSLKDVRDIGRSFKLQNVSGTKDSVTLKLIKLCQTQTTLSVCNTEQILKRKIKEKMGYCVKLSSRLSKCLYSMFLLNTFTNSSLTDPQDYFKNVSYFQVVFPKYEIEKFHIFYTPQEFLRYADAVKLRSELDKALEGRKHIHIFEICRCAYNMLKQVNDECGNAFETSKEPHLERFTSNAKYASILTSGSKHITSHNHDDVKIWYEYLLSQGFCQHKRGEWYCQLALIYTQYEKNYKKAAELLIKALREEKDNFSDIQLQELAHRGKMLNKKTYNLSRGFHDDIAALSPPFCERTWPQDVLDCKSVHSEESGKKRVYVRRCENGDKTYLTVEQTALEYYRGLGFPNGEHCEGRLIIAAFSLLFWDIMYETYVKGTFVSSVQSVPLDMYSEHFYENRSVLIKKRLNYISQKWSDETLEKKIFINWDRHSHERSVCQIDSSVEGPKYLFDIIMCIGRPVLAKILERLVKNFRIYHSGLPDLILWNVQEKKAKFVEVKSENDTLSIKQKLWLNYLIDVGACVAVCHVEPKSSKKKITKK